MAAKTQIDLIQITEKEYAKLTKLIASVSSEQALQKDEDGISIKDVVAHRAHWTDMFLGWYADGLAGKIVYFPAKGYKWNDLKRYNAALRERQADLEWPAARKLLDQGYAKLRQFITDKFDAALYGGPMKRANNQWTPGRWAEAAGPSHFRSASKSSDRNAPVRSSSASPRS